MGFDDKVCRSSSHYMVPVIIFNIIFVAVVSGSLWAPCVLSDFAFSIVCGLWYVQIVCFGVQPKFSGEDLSMLKWSAEPQVDMQICF